MKPKFFETAAEWRNWLEQNHASQQELLVGFHKKDSGKPSITWPEAVDGALCFGWIDGVRRRIDDISYSIRFTPRKPRSIWSAVNTKRVAELTIAGLMHPSGRKAFEARSEDRSGIYAFEQETIAFEQAQEKQFRASKAAWKFFSAQANWYRRTATWWVISAKRDETKVKRLASLIEHSEAGRLLPHLRRSSDSAAASV